MFNTRQEPTSFQKSATALAADKGYTLTAENLAAAAGHPAPDLEPAIARLTEEAEARSGGHADWSAAFGEDTIVGTPGRDTLIGTAGDDTLDGGLGRDKMYGGLGNDTYFVDNTKDGVFEDAGAGTDTVFSSSSFTAPLNVENVTLTGLNKINATGNDLDNVLTGNTKSNILIGGLGSDTLIGSDGFSPARDTLIGGQGDDIYQIYDNSKLNTILENPGEGTDTVVIEGYFGEYYVDANIENVILKDCISFDVYGNELSNVISGFGYGRAFGGAGNDTLYGGGSMHGDEGDDFLYAGSNDDFIFGGRGTDYLSGGAGGDVLYLEDQGADTVDGGNGVDSLTANYSDAVVGLNLTVGTVVSGNIQVVNVEDCAFYLGSGSDYLSVGTSGTRLTAYGGWGDDTLIGGDDVDALHGDGGNDHLFGGAGADTFFVSDQGIDIIDGGIGFDILNADYSQSHVGVNFTLGTVVAGNIQVVNLELVYFRLGTGDDFLSAGESGAMLYADGGDGDDTLIGGSGDDTLNGDFGDDLIFGGGGYDIFHVTAGNDSIDGGAGSNNFYVYDQSIKIIDGGDDMDSLRASFAGSGVGLNLTIGKVVAGNMQVLNMEDLQFILGSGSDYLSGGSSNAILKVDGGYGDDTLIGGGGYDSINGGAGNDTLGDGAGGDTLVGGAGNDSIQLGDDFFADVVILNSLSGSDTLYSFNKFNSWDHVVVSSAFLPLGDGDSTLEGAKTRAAPGGFDTTAELVVFSSDISGSITADAAAAKIGNATNAYSVGQTALFVVDNGLDSAIYYFQSAGQDSLVSASELTLLATLVGNSSTGVGDYLLGA